MIQCPVYLFRPARSQPVDDGGAQRGRCQFDGRTELRLEGLIDTPRSTCRIAGSAESTQLRVIPTFARESIPNTVCLCMAYYVQRRQMDQCLETFDQYKMENQIA